MFIIDDTVINSCVRCYVVVFLQYRKQHISVTCVVLLVPASLTSQLCVLIACLTYFHYQILPLLHIGLQKCDQCV